MKRLQNNENLNENQHAFICIFQIKGGKKVGLHKSTRMYKTKHLNTRLIKGREAMFQEPNSGILSSF